MTLPILRPRDRDALIHSLRSGVTPRTGARHIQVGRDAEIAALDKDLDRIAEGGASFRLIIGDFGSGKTFFLKRATLHSWHAPYRQTRSRGRGLYPDRDELFRECPELDAEDVRQALGFAACNLDDSVIKLEAA
ncbi:MAG: BREX system ATP-binding domain-containing protein [Thiobacillus sp.]